jgi:RimJ/RimL family protein N-acetyltransferase
VQHLRREAEPPDDLEPLRANPLELGWRLHPDYWGRGLATEGAIHMARHAFDGLDADALYAVRHPDNATSGQVMERLGMRYVGLEAWYGRPLATHRLMRSEWLQRPADVLG